MGCEDINRTGAEKCKGLKPRTVKIRQGDLMLCDDCNERRFGKPSNTTRLNQGMVETPKRSDQQQGRKAPKRNTPAKMSVQEAANAVEVTHLKNIDNMSISQLKAFDLEATRILVQGTVASLVPIWMLTLLPSRMKASCKATHGQSTGIYIFTFIPS